MKVDRRLLTFDVTDGGDVFLKHAACLECPGITEHETLLLLALSADGAANQAGCFPGQARLVRRTKMSRSTLRKATAGLAEKGLLWVHGYGEEYPEGMPERYGDAARARSNYYAVRWDAIRNRINTAIECAGDAHSISGPGGKPSGGNAAECAGDAHTTHNGCAGDAPGGRGRRASDARETRTRGAGDAPYKTREKTREKTNNQPGEPDAIREAGDGRAGVVVGMLTGAGVRLNTAERLAGLEHASEEYVGSMIETVRLDSGVRNPPAVIVDRVDLKLSPTPEGVRAWKRRLAPHADAEAVAKRRRDAEEREAAALQAVESDRETLKAWTDRKADDELERIQNAAIASGRLDRFTIERLRLANTPEKLRKRSIASILQEFEHQRSGAKPAEAVA